MKRTFLNIGAAVLVGVLLRFVVNLDPVWWLAWFAPGLLFALSLRTEGFWVRQAVVALAAAIGVSANFAYFSSVMPVPAVIGVMFGQTLLWVLMIGLSRRVVSTFRAGWTVLALPVIFVAVDTALAHFTPDGNWGSLGYTQAEVLPIEQLAAVAGVGGILFVLMLLNSALALALQFRMKLPGAVTAYSASVATFVLAAVFGWWRLQVPVDGREVAFGIAAIDDFLGSTPNEASRAVWDQYDAQVMTLAGSGAQIILLPEKIAVLSTEDASARQKKLRDLAAANKVWLVAGLGVDDGKERRNEAWWYGPDGKLVVNYLKHFMAPPEREFVAGSEYPTHDIDGVKYGVAICKDMHFASLGRGFGARDAGVMLVPAWDFYRDRFMAMNMTKLRGIESGFSIVRSARDGLLTISDPYGRVVAVEESAKLPGSAILAKAKVGARLPTIYGRIGDALGWLCLVLAPFLIVATFVRPVRR
jgi:apolipoprotein N-acyltransferase